MAEPHWLTKARAHIGVKEVPGPASSPKIMGWAKSLGSRILGIAYSDDAVPWCGLFMAQVMKEAGIMAPPIAVRASSWGSWGRQLNGPRLGCVLVFTRSGGGHVGLYIGEDKTHFHVLGGNQGNAVSITRIAKDRLASGGMRWPHGQFLPEAKSVWLNSAGVPVTVNER